MAKTLLFVDDEKAAESESLVLLVDTVRLGDLSRFISQQRQVERAEAALLAWSINPGQVTKVRIGRAGNELAVNLAELVGTLRESYDLSRAHKRTKR